jgi:hypothetical protein
MPVSAGMHESGPRRPGEGIRTITLHNFPRTAVGEGRDPSISILDGPRSATG